MKLRLRAKILLLIAGTATGLASVILLAFTLIISREMARAVHEDVRATGGVLGQLMRDRSAVLLDQSLLIADQPVLRAALSTHDPATVLDRARDYRKALAVDEIIVTDRDGCVLGDTDGQSKAGTDLSRVAGVAAAMANRPWQGIVGREGRLMLAVSVPVKIGAYPVGDIHSLPRYRLDRRAKPTGVFGNRCRFDAGRSCSGAGCFPLDAGGIASSIAERLQLPRGFFGLSKSGSAVRSGKAS